MFVYYSTLELGLWFKLSGSSLRFFLFVFLNLGFCYDMVILLLLQCVFDMNVVAELSGWCWRPEAALELVWRTD